MVSNQTEESKLMYNRVTYINLVKTLIDVRARYMYIQGSADSASSFVLQSISKCVVRPPNN